MDIPIVVMLNHLIDNLLLITARILAPLFWNFFFRLQLWLFFHWLLENLCLACHLQLSTMTLKKWVEII